jgi:hypothetical protein
MLAMKTLLFLMMMPAAGVDAAEVQAAQSPRGAGARVVATVTTLEGTVHMAGMQVELRQADGTVLASTVTDTAGQVMFPDVPPGRYTVKSIRPGFVDAESAPFEVHAGETKEVLIDTQLTFTPPTVEVRADPAATDSVQPVSMSDMLNGSVLDSAPLEGDDFKSLMPMLPGVVRDAEGRLRIKGGQPTQGALQVSAASLVDPSTGDFDLDLPGQSVESVEVLANPFAAEYGRFSSSVTQVRTRRGTNVWEMKYGNYFPRFKGFFKTIRGFEPRFGIHGPLKKNRIFLAQDFQYRYVATPVKSLPDEPEVKLNSLDSFTRVDVFASARHTMTGGLILFPRKVRHATLNTFRPVPTTPEFNQSGLSTGYVDRFALGPDAVLESTIAFRKFEVNVNTENTVNMAYTPETQAGGFFNDQERNVTSLQWVESLTLSRDWHGQHVFKFGTDVQRSHYDGFSFSRPIEVHRLDGSIAELTEWSGRSQQEVNGTELGAYVQDRWRIGGRMTVEAGFRVDYDPVVGHDNYSPRAGMALTILSDGRAILRGGYGKFVQRTPLNVEAFPTFEERRVTRFAPDGTRLGPTVFYRNVVGPLHAPEANVANVELDQRYGRRLLLKLAFLHRTGSHEYILQADPAASQVVLSSGGSSRYREIEATTRFLGGERRDLTLSYVWARGLADLNSYDYFYGNIRNPILRANENNLIPTDVRHRLLLRGTIGIGSKWDLAPVVELRSGFPYSAVNEFLDFVGPRNRAGRLPSVRSVDFSLSRPWHFRKYRFRAGVKIYNVFGVDANRDIQNNLTSPNYGTSYNPLQRSIGFVFGSAK